MIDLRDTNFVLSRVVYGAGILTIDIRHLFVRLFNAITGGFDPLLGHTFPEFVFLGRLLGVLDSIANGLVSHPIKVFLRLFVGHAGPSQVLQLWRVVQDDDDKASARTYGAVDIFLGHTVHSLTEQRNLSTIFRLAI